MTATGVILADEVGLGKTIEAGLLYTELALRGLAQTALILAPKSLLPQWQEQLRELFDADFTLTDEKRFSGFESRATSDLLVAAVRALLRQIARTHIRPGDR